MKRLPKTLLRKALFVVILLSSTAMMLPPGGGYSITGAENVNQGDTETYNITPTSNVDYTYWSVSGGTITSQNHLYANVNWTGSSTGTVSATVEDIFLDSYTLIPLYVTITASAPTTPPSPTVQSSSCGQVVLARATPPSGVTYYWQSSSTGTSTSNSSSTITRTTGSVYYLRARNSSNLWSTTSSSVSYSIPSAPTWYADTDGDGFGDPNTTISQCTQPAGYVSDNSDGCPTDYGLADGCPFGDENYVHTTVYQNPYNSSQIVNASEHEKIENITYYDGLGRPMQNIAIRGGGDKQKNNLINWKDNWIAGTQGQANFFKRTATDAENARVLGEDPYGGQSVLWEADGSIDGTGPDGGWVSDYFSVDNTETYMYTVWFKNTGAKNGRVYHGMKDVNKLDGTAHTNPYFRSQNTTSFNLDQWYLLVGVIHPAGYSGSGSGLTGIYNINGTKIVGGTEFEWRTDVNKQYKIRSFFYNGTAANEKMYFYNPMFQKLNGSELTIEEMLEGNSAKDVITHIDYDDFGRKDKDYLPVAVGQNNGLYKSIDVFNDIQSYYYDKFSNEWANQTDANPYSQTEFETSPISRVLRQAAPGEDWKLDNNHEIKMDYGSNSTNEVRMFTVTTTYDSTNNIYEPSLQAPGDYDPNELYKTITKDENWVSGSDHTTEEFKDKQNRVVLKRSYNSGAHDTYYVYDDFGNLSYVLTPKMEADTKSISEINNSLDELGYQYKYDERNRLVEKKIPGKDWEYVLYNKIDQPIFTQDGVQRNQTTKEWIFTKYDAFGRVAYTGLRAYNKTRGEYQNAITTSSAPVAETSRTSATTIAGTNIFYNHVAIPTTVDEIFTINYYDSYVDVGSGTNPGNNIYNVPISTNVKGLPTVSKVRVLETDDWITTVTYYDDKGRVIYVYSYNEHLNTTDITEYKLDFTGRVLETTNSHTYDLNNPIVTVDVFEYDHMGRLVSQKQKIDSQAVEVIVDNYYDDLGQLFGKGVGGKTTNVRLQTIDYTYNIRGWLEQINDPSSLGNDLFSFRINYNTSEIGRTASTFTELYNGNISETIWKTANDISNNITRGYAYDYDALNRIKYADLGIKTTGSYALGSGFDLRVDSYDKNGNIISLYRNSESPGDGMDDLRYTYDSGNRLLKVDEVVGSTGYEDNGFKDGINSGNDYSYDENGNMINDANKGITSIAYNHLNLPTIINFGASDKIEYIYDATGIKLQKKVTDNNNVTTTDYLGNYIYQDNELQFIFTPEGYATPNGSNFENVYQYKDHLGNIRLSYMDSDGNGGVSQSEIIEENNYYPFGLKHIGYNNNIVSEHPYKYNGKELNDELGLDWYDLGARNLDHALGRFMNVDPLAADAPAWSPYNAMWNNPILNVDPDGRWANPVFGSDGTYKGDTKEGYTGEVIIYDGDVDFSKMSKDELLATKGADTYDNQRGSLTGDAKSNIWTHITSQLEGQQIYDETFSMSDLTGGKIHFDYDKKPKGSWVSSYVLGKGKGKIRGSDKYSYSTTVENIQSSVVVHEWYSHIKKNNGDGFDSHRLAYKNVINFKSLWNNTTDGYKGFNMRGLLKYTKSESNNKKTQVDPLYRNLYKKYHKKYD